jgi:hypothetical protein
MAVTNEDLQKLPLRAIVAFAARCARRVQPIYQSRATPNDRTRLDFEVETIERYARDESDTNHVALVNSLTTSYTSSHSPTDPRSVRFLRAATNAAASAASAAYAHAAAVVPNSAAAAAYASDAAAAARSAADVYGRDSSDAADTGAFDDFRELIGSKLGRPGEAGQPIDPSESGPLGPLWPKGEPEWFAQARAAANETAPEDTEAAEFKLEGDPVAELLNSKPAPQIFAYFDGSGFTQKEIALCLSYLSECYRDLGGSGLKLVGAGQTLVPDGAEVRP